MTIPPIPHAPSLPKQSKFAPVELSESEHALMLIAGESEDVLFLGDGYIDIRLFVTVEYSSLLS